MGVRGKIEAVIYAAEEPVTLAQLTALFGAEALAERAAPSEQAEPDFEPGADSELALEDELEPDLGVAQNAVAEAEGQPQNVNLSSDLSSASAADPSADTAGLEEPYQATGEPTLLGDPDADRRAARLRDRHTRDAVRAVVDTLIAEYQGGERGMEIREIAGGYRVATKPEYHDAVRAFVKSLKPPMKLSLQALETLAVIAYKQPVTSPEVSEIRGVDSGGVLGSLISRKLVTTAGRKQVVGRPILYKTTKEFLLRFGLKDLAELPSMEEFEKMASELESLAEEPGGETAPLLAGLEMEPDTPEPTEPVIEVDVAEPPVPGVSVEAGGHAQADQPIDAEEQTLSHAATESAEEA